MGSLTKTLGVALIVTAVGCLPPAKESVELPPSTSDLEAELVTSIATDLIDVRNLVVKGDRLYVADASGLHIFDITDRAQPSALGTISDGPVNSVAILDDRAYLIEINDDRLREWNISNPSSPVAITDVFSLTRTFGALAARDGLVWHAVGSSPPSRLYYRQPLDIDAACLGADNERGAMGVWLFDGLTVLAIHFDDFAGDDFDGRGGYGFAITNVGPTTDGCPDLDVRDVVLIPSHANNRSEFEAGSNSDLQASYDPGRRTLVLTGGQRLRKMTISPRGEAQDVQTLLFPEILDASIDSSGVVVVANGDVGIVDGRLGGLEFSQLVTTPGTARAVAVAGDRRHVYVADGEAGLAVIVYGDSL